MTDKNSNQNWTERRNRLGPLGLKNLDWTDKIGLIGKIWIKRKMNPGPEIGFKAWKFGFKARTKYGVYSHVIHFLFHHQYMLLVLSIRIMPNMVDDEN